MKNPLLHRPRHLYSYVWWLLIPFMALAILLYFAWRSIYDIYVAGRNRRRVEP